MTTTVGLYPHVVDGVRLGHQAVLALVPLSVVSDAVAFPGGERPRSNDGNDGGER